MPSVLTKTKALLVEGTNEEDFFESLFDHLAYNDIQLLTYPKDKLTDFLRTFMVSDGYDNLTAFGIIRDADRDHNGAFNSVVSSLDVAKLQYPKRSGEFKNNRDGKKIGIFIMPGNSESGMLEDLCLATVDAHPIMPHVKIFFDSLRNILVKRDPLDAPMESGKHYFPKNEAKARVQAFLSGTHRVPNTAGRGAKCKYWDFEHNAMKNLKDFLVKLRTPI